MNVRFFTLEKGRKKARTQNKKYTAFIVDLLVIDARR
jgi:hypothetical protein